MRRYLLPFVAVLVYQLRVGANVPWSDEWLFLPWLDRHFETGSLEGLFEPHAGHRAAAVRLLLLGSAYLDNLDFRHLRLAGGLILLGAVWVVFRMTGPGGGWRMLLPCGMTMLSLRQWENLDWGMQACVFLMLLSCVAAIRALDRGRILLAAAAGAAAPLCWAGGIMIWPALTVQAWLTYPRSKIPWIFAAGSVLMGAWHGGGVRLWFNVPGAVEYALTNLAGAIVSEEAPAGALPVVGLLIAILHGLGIAAFLRAAPEERRAAIPFLALSVFALLNTAGLVAARYAIGLIQPGASRYSTATMAGLAGALGLLTICRGPRLARAALTLLMIAGPLYTDFVMLRMSPWVRSYGQNLVRAVRAPSRTAKDLEPFQMHLDRIEPGIEIMRRRQWGPFSCACP